MLTNLTEVKKLLQITTTDKDSLITDLIPLVTEHICTYLNWHFTNNMIYEGTFIFDGLTIDFQDSDYDIEYPLNTDIYVKKTHYNNDFYTVRNISNGVITVNKPLTTETVYTRIFGVSYPKDSFIKKIVAEMIDYNINPEKYNVVSEALGEASVTFTNNGTTSGYPKGIINKLEMYRGNH